MNDSLFFRALVDEDKAIALKQVIDNINKGKNPKSTTYIANASSFSKIPGSPFAYWVSDHIRNTFAKILPCEIEGRTVKQGLVTADDFRFLRLWWEIEAEKIITGTKKTQKYITQQTFAGMRWARFAKGGAYSPYYADIYLVVNWEQDGKEIKDFKNPQTGKLFSRPQNIGFYFLAGLTWPLRTTSGISIRILPQDCIFSHKGPAVFTSFEERKPLLGLMNSKAFEGLIALQLGAADAAARSYEVGLVQNTPIPDLSSHDGVRLGELAIVCVQAKRTLDTANETSHLFNLPALLQVVGVTLYERCSKWQTLMADAKFRISKCQQEIDDIAFQLYDIDNEDRQAIEESLKSKKQALETDTAIILDEEEDTDSKSSSDLQDLVTDSIAYTIGCAFGRWDIRFATTEKSAPDLPDPFGSLPICAPGALVGSDGLPLHEPPLEYPLKINWTGILVDDQEHLDDIVRSVRSVLELIWKNQAENIEQEICQILGLKELREYFRKPGKDNFWAHHLQRYSKSRRKAPIYWHLQSSKKNYSIWLYYHRLNKDMLFKALVNYVEPKLRVEDARLEQLQSQYKSAAKGSREARQLEKPIEVQGSFLAELKDFREKLRRVADLGLEPDLNDGVVLNIAPLWELVPWNEAKKYWEELLAGKYEWSSISKQLHEKGLV